MIGGLLLGVGAILAGAVGKSIVVMVIAYGVIGGLGVGFAYVTPVATCVKWFPDKRGMITGIAVFGFGAGTLVFGPVIDALLKSIGIAPTFYVLGLLFIVAVCGAGSLFRVPPSRWKPAGWNPVSTAAVAKADWTPAEMGGTRQFWTLWVVYFFWAAAGLMMIGQAVPIGIEIANLEKGVAASGLGIMALFSGLGRLAWGAVSDRLGRLRAVILMFVGLMVALVLVLPYAGSFATWLVGMCLVGFSFGGFLAVMPSVTADFYGLRCYGACYGYLFTAYGIAGVAGPYLIDYMKTSTGGFTAAMYVMAGAAALGLLLSLTIRPPKHASEAVAELA